MRETRADTTQALFLALGLHVLLFLLAFVGLWWTRTNAQVSAAGPVIEAELIDASALSASMRRTRTRSCNGLKPFMARCSSSDPNPIWWTICAKRRHAALMAIN